MQPENHRALKTLTRSLTQSPGRFSLILVRCNYTSLRDRFLTQLGKQCSIEKLILSPSSKTLYTTIAQQFEQQPPDAVIVLGLESVVALDDLLGATNKLRDQFRSFPFPVVLWVTNRVFQQLMRVAPDFKSWAGPPIEFMLPDEELLGLVQQQAEEAFAEEPSLIVGVDEIAAFEQDLQSRGLELDAEIQASLALLKGLMEEREHRFDAAVGYYQQSLAFWNPPLSACPNPKADVGAKHLGDNSSEESELYNPNASPCDNLTISINHSPGNPPPNPLPGGGVREGVVLLHLGLAYYRKGEQYWLESKNYLQQSLNKFEEAQRRDLVAKHINQLGKVLQGLEDWESLENLAQQALELHQNLGNPGRLAEDYGFLAEVALQKQRWQEAKELAQKALKILDSSPNVPEKLFPSASCLLPPAFYYLILARSQQGLGEKLNAIANLKQAKEQTRPQEQLTLYLEILKELRSLYFEQGQYREAFYLKLEQREVESRYGLRAFVGAGRLQPPVLRRGDGETGGCSEGLIVKDIVAASGRKQDLERLLERVKRPDCKLTVIHGQSGVGKSSILQAGLVPALEVSFFEGREAVPVFVDVYTDWVGELGKGLSINRESRLELKFKANSSSRLKSTETSMESATTASVQKPDFLAKNADVSLLSSEETQFSEIQTSPLQRTLAMSQGINSLADEALMPESPSSSESPFKLQTILEQLRQNEQRYQLTVLIFDQFEEFFFVYKDQGSRRPFYEFLRQCLEIPYLKIILSLREDYLHYLLELTRTTNLEGFDDNYKHLLYYLGNFSPADAKSVIWNLTQRSQFYLEPDLLEELVKELAGEGGEVRPIELQIVGAQLQADHITTLEQYRVTGTKDELVKQFLAEVVQDCGTRNEQQIANLVLYLLTDENNTRPFKTREDLELELEVEAEKLDLVVEVLVKSGIVLRVPGTPANRYQLVHDYLVSFIRTQNPESARLIAELEREREQRKLTEKKLNEALTRELREVRRGLVWKVSLGAIAGGLAMVLPLLLIGQNNTYLSSMSDKSNKFLSSNKDLQALVESIKAGKRLKRWEIGVKPETKTQVVAALQEVVHTIRERNSFEGHKDSVTSVSFSPDGKLIASGSADNTVKLWSLDGEDVKIWRSDGSLLKNIYNYRGAKNINIQGQTIMKSNYHSNEINLTLFQTDNKYKEINLTLNGHRNEVTSVSFSPDGKMLASGSEDNTVKLWHLETSSFESNEYVTSISISPDGKMIASASTNYPYIVKDELKLWSLDGKPIETFKGVNANASFSPDSQMLASASMDRTVQLWSKDLAGLDSQKNIASVSYSEDGQTIALVKTDNTVQLLGKDGRLLKTLKGNKEKIDRVDFSADGQTVATTSNDQIVKLWQRDGKLLTPLKGHSDRIYRVDLSPDGQTIATASDDQTVKLWQQDGRLIKTLTGYNVQGLSFSPDSETLVIRGGDNTVKFLRRDGTLLEIVKGYGYWQMQVSFSPDGETLAILDWGKDENTLEIRYIDGTLLKTFQVDGQLIGFSDDGKTIVTTTFGESQFWKLDGTVLSTFEKNVWHYSPDYRVIATREDKKTFKLWRRDGTQLSTIPIKGKFLYNGGNYKGFHLSPDNKTLALQTSENTVELWNSDGTFIKTIQFESDRFRNSLGKLISLPMSFSPNSQILAIRTDDNKVELWSVNGKLIDTIQGQVDAVTDLSFLPESEILVISGYNDVVKLWQHDGKELKVLPDHGNHVNQVSFSPDGNTIVSASDDRTFKLWNPDATLIKTIDKHSDKVNDVSFSPDGKTIASASEDKTVKLWNPDGTLIKSLEEHSNGVNDVSFSPNGKLIASASEDKTVKLWSFEEGEVTFLDTLDHDYPVTSVSFHPKDELIASASWKKAKLWSLDGEEVATFDRLGGDVSFSLDGNSIVGIGYEGVALRNFNLDQLLERGCNWARDYLKNNPSVAKKDRKLCDDI
ncbi:MAG: tetratricopeptide repeat protein [Symploca sp. SIO2E6]|nr:tetratricopeptide repeat protein [Symploca sp. SIO2E6]